MLRQSFMSTSDSLSQLTLRRSDSYMRSSVAFSHAATNEAPVEPVNSNTMSPPAPPPNHRKFWQAKPDAFAWRKRHLRHKLQCQRGYGASLRSACIICTSVRQRNEPRKCASERNEACERASQARGLQANPNPETHNNMLACLSFSCAWQWDYLLHRKNHKSTIVLSYLRKIINQGLNLLSYLRWRSSA